MYIIRLYTFVYVYYLKIDATYVRASSSTAQTLAPHVFPPVGNISLLLGLLVLLSVPRHGFVSHPGHIIVAVTSTSRARA